MSTIFGIVLYMKDNHLLDTSCRHEYAFCVNVVSIWVNFMQILLSSSAFSQFNVYRNFRFRWQSPGCCIFFWNWLIFRVWLFFLMKEASLKMRWHFEGCKLYPKCFPYFETLSRSWRMFSNFPATGLSSAHHRSNIRSFSTFFQWKNWDTTHCQSEVVALCCAFPWQ